MLNIFGGFVEAHPGGRYLCRLCRANFFGQSAILQHCRNTSKHAWCERCKRIFATAEAKKEHLMSSLHHHMCFECEDKPDFQTEDELENHLGTAHFWCGDCDAFGNSRLELQDHVRAAHRECTVCSRTFVDATTLRQHMIAHESRSFKCPGCRQAYARYSHLLLHLERGTCATLWRVKTIAFRYSDRGAYGSNIMDKEPFHCGGCAKAFACLSSLYSHVEDTKKCFHLLQPHQPLYLLRSYILENLD